MNDDPTNGPGSVLLAPVLDLNAAAPLARELTDLRGRPLVVDGSAVQRLGGPCLQVLLSAKATWEADGQSFALTGPSEALSTALDLMGAAQSFSDPALADPTFQTPELSQ